MDGAGGNTTENIGKYAIIGAAVVGVILYFTLTISFSVACFLCRKRPNRQGNEVRSEDSTVEPVRQEIQTRIHTLSSTVMDSNDRIVLVYQLSSGSDTVFAMDVPQSSDLGSVYEEEAAIDSSNTCTPDLPPRTEEMYITTDGFPCFSRSPSPLPPPLHPLECSGEDIHYQVAPTTQAVWLTDPSNTTLPLEEHTPLSQQDPSNTTLPLEEHTPLSQQDPSNTTLPLEEHTPLSQQDPSNTTLEHTPLLQQSPPAMNNAHTVKTPCQQPSLTPVANEETDPLTFLHKEAPQRSDYENIVPPSTVQPFPTTLTPEHILLSQQQSVPAMNNVHTIKTPCQQPPHTPVLNEETSPSTFLHKESPHKADYKNIVSPERSLQAVQPAVQPSPPISTTLTPGHISLSQQQSAPAVTNAHTKPHSPCQQPPLTPVINGPPPFLPREPSHIPHYENTVPSSLPPLQTPNLPASHHTVIELPPRHIRRYPLPSSGGEGDHKHDIFLKYNESYHSLMKHFNLF